MVVLTPMGLSGRRAPRWLAVIGLFVPLTVLVSLNRRRRLINVLMEGLTGTVRLAVIR